MTLQDAYKGFFTIGAATSPMTLLSSDDLLKTHFSGMTPENIMKPESLQPSEGNFNFKEAGDFLKYAESNNMSVHGHVLVWHNQTGAWMFKDGTGAASPELLEKRMNNHIRTVLEHFKGRITSWDVVNEAISDSNNSQFREDSPWYQIMGPDFIEKAFRTAHEADPAVKLYYNDYNVVDPGKRERIYTLLKNLLDDGVPVHGIGIQGHWSLFHPTVSEVEKTIDLFAGLGLDVKVTELDLSIYAFNDKDHRYAEAPEDLLEIQAVKYADLFKLFRRKSNDIEGVTFWGVADDHTWLDHFPEKNRKNWPLLFDENHNKKPAYNAVIEASYQG